MYDNYEFIKASLSLHSAVAASEKSCYSRDLLKYGYIAPDNLSETAKSVLIEEAVKLNSTFYKSWHDVTSKTREELAIDQFYHYISVAISDIYGCGEIVYVPNKTDEPRSPQEQSVPFRFIKGLTVEEIKDLTKAILHEKVALNESTIEAAFKILQTHEVDIDKVQNRDSRTYIFVKHGIEPQTPLEILRCAVYDVTGELTLIKNEDMYKKIEYGDIARVIRWLKGNEERLATIFNRYKPIFMSMKTYYYAKSYINRISKLSKKLHIPLKASTNEPSTGYEVVKHVKYLIQNKKPKVYHVRNGNMWCTRDRKNEIDKYVSKLKGLLPDTFVQSPYTRLALPTSEKNFCGAFPMGTKFGSFPGGALIIGIHWKNKNGRRVDLDLSAVDMEGKVGWNSDYYTDCKNVIYSGDMTDASNGANEYLYFKNITNPKVVLVNKYTSHQEEVNMDVIVATSGSAPLKNAVLDDKDVIATASTVCDERQKTLGIVYPTDDGPMFVLIDKCIGKKLMVSSANEDSDIMINAFMNDYIYIDEYATATSTERATEGRRAGLRPASSAGGSAATSETQSVIDLSNETISKYAMLNIFK